MVKEKDNSIESLEGIGFQKKKKGEIFNEREEGKSPEPREMRTQKTRSQLHSDLIEE